MAAVTQVRHRDNPGRAYYDRKVAEGKTGKEAPRALKRRVSDAIYAQLQIGARRAAANRELNGARRATGERLCLQRARLTPRTRHNPTTPD